MRSDKERLAFAKRLRDRLLRLTPPVVGPTALAREFALRHPSEPISQQTAHKWLAGKAFPTGEKVDTLVRWLRVDRDWLLFGEGANEEGLEQTRALVRDELEKMLPDLLAEGMELMFEVLEQPQTRGKSGIRRYVVLRDALREHMKAKATSELSMAPPGTATPADPKIRSK